MKSILLKYFLVAMSFVLAFNIISPSLAEASESQNSHISNVITETTVNNEFENNLTIESNNLNQDLLVNPVDSTYPVTDLFNPEYEVQPLALPLVVVPLAGLVIRSGVQYLVRTSSKQVLLLSDHATKQAVLRNITGEMIDQALSNGVKYVDILSGERVAWHENGNGVAVLLKKNSDEIDTVYPEDHKKLKWLKNGWQYVGDFKK